MCKHDGELVEHPEQSTGNWIVADRLLYRPAMLSMWKGKEEGRGKPPPTECWISRGRYGKGRAMGEGGMYSRTMLTLLSGVGLRRCKVKDAFGAIFNAGVGVSLQPSLIKLGETRDHQA